MRALIVDNKQDNLHILEKILKKLEYEVVSACNGEEALEKLQIGRIDLIVSDVLMPVMDGYQLCRKVKGNEKLKTIPFIFYTATYVDEEDEKFALKLGADRYLRKPLEPEDFIKAIKDVITAEKSGRIKPALKECKEIFKLYSKRLVNKLENKMLVLEREITESKLVEETLKKSKETAERYLNIAAELIITLDTKGNITLLNKSGHGLLGYKTGELIGRNWFDTCLPEKMRKEVQEVFKKLMQGDVENVETYENPVLTKNGEERMILWHDTLLRNDEERITGLLSSGEDITERKQAEAKIQHLNLVLRAIRNVNQLIVREKDPERLIKKACKNLVKNRGYRSAWIALRNDEEKYETVVQSGLGSEFKNLQKQFKQGRLNACGRRTMEQSGIVNIEDVKSVCGDCPLLGKAHKCRTLAVRLEYESKIYGLIVVSMPVQFVKDEEERSLFEEIAGDIAFALHNIELEQALRERERRFSEIIEGNSIATFVINTDHVVTHWNKASENMLGIPAKEMIGSKETWRSFYPKKRPVLADLIVDNVSNEDIAGYYGDRLKKSAVIEGAYEAEVFFPGLGENGRWFHFTAAPLRDNEKKVDGAIETLQDITERKLAEEELTKHREHLEELIKERTTELEEKNKELERYNRLFEDREFRIKELKDKVKELEKIKNLRGLPIN